MATITLTTAFDLASSPKQFVFQDTTDYAGQSIATTDVVGCLVIVAPSGPYYSNTTYTTLGCDINIDADRGLQNPIPLPVDSSGNVELGVYVITYTVYNSDLAEYYTISYSYNFTYESPTVDITQSASCSTPLFRSVDATNYVVGGVTPSITRVHTLNYPYIAPGTPVASPVTTSAAYINTGVFYNGTQTTTIQSTLTYVFDSGLTVYDVISGEKEILVDCQSLCAIYCCLRSIYNQWVAQRGVNPTEYARLGLLYADLMSTMFMAEFAQSCGKDDEVSGYLSQIKLLANCNDDCSCSGDTPTQVVGFGPQVSTSPQLYAYTYATNTGAGVSTTATDPHTMSVCVFEGTNYHGATPATMEILYSLAGTDLIEFTITGLPSGKTYATANLTPTAGLLKPMTVLDASATQDALYLKITDKKAQDNFTLYAFNIKF